MIGKARLPFDVLTVIAYISIKVYRALLAIPRFGRASYLPVSLHERINRHQLLYQTHFTTRITYSDGTQAWYLKLTIPVQHHLDGPAIILPDGSQMWWYAGKRHRAGGDPAIIYANGDKLWYVNGKRYRLDGPAVIRANGTRVWYINDRPHRVGGAAFIGADGMRAWYINGVLHRLDGPAVIRMNGTEEYWINGEKMTKEKFMGMLV
jgi:hypothetical protein